MAAILIFIGYFLGYHAHRYTCIISSLLCLSHEMYSAVDRIQYQDYLDRQFNAIAGASQ